MNVDTGSLRNLLQGEPVPKGFEIVPPEHQKEAEEILSGKKEATADMNSNTPLVVWAKSQQIKILQRHSKSKREMRKKSQRINRGK